MTLRCACGAKWFSCSPGVEPEYWAEGGLRLTPGVPMQVLCFRCWLDAGLQASQRLRLAQPVRIAFRLARPLPLWNPMLRTHWAKRRKILKALATEVGWAIKAAGYQLPERPFAKATVTAIRRSVGTPDPDGLSSKFLRDVLQPCSTRHPYGLGVILDDTEECLGPGVGIRAECVAHLDEQCTLVEILGDPPL